MLKHNLHDFFNGLIGQDRENMSVSHGNTTFPDMPTYHCVRCKRATEAPEKR